MYAICVQRPAFISETQFEIAASHLPQWKAFVSLKLPVYPLHKIKFGVQVLYSILKPGVDGVTQYISQLRSHTMRYTYDQKVVTDVLFSLVANTVILYRILQELNGMPLTKSVDKFRAACSRRCSFADCVVKLAAQLVKDVMESQYASQVLAHVMVPASTTPTHDTPTRPIKKRKNRVEYFNQPERKHIRLSSVGMHRVSMGKYRGKCILCNSDVTSSCSLCTRSTGVKTILCRRIRAPNKEPCFDIFHNRINLLSLETANV